MTHLFLFILTIISYEIFLFFKIKFFIIENIHLCKKLTKLFTFKRVSDHHKQKVIIGYSKEIFLTSIKVLFLTSLIFLIFLIFTFIDSDLFNLLFSINGSIELLIFILIYYKFKKYFL